MINWWDELIRLIGEHGHARVEFYMASDLLVPYNINPDEMTPIYIGDVQWDEKLDEIRVILSP